MTLPELYAALEEADRKAQAGDEEARQDAIELASMIEQFKESSSSAQEPDTVSPIIIGTATGIAAGAKGATEMLPTAENIARANRIINPPAAAPSAPTTPAATTPHGFHPGATSNAQFNAEQIEANKLLKPGNVPPGYKVEGNSRLIVPTTVDTAVKGTSPVIASKQEARQIALDKLKRGTTATGQFAGKVPGINVVTGGMAGYQGADAYNRAQRGDVPGAVVSGIGSAGSATSTLLGKKHPIARIGGLGVGLLAPVVNRAIDAQSTKEEKAMGGLVGCAAGGAIQGYAKGQKVIEEIVNLGKKFKYNPKDVSSNYPKTIPPVLAKDKKTGNEYLQKQLSEEAKAVQNARKYAQGEIDKGQYTPFFDISKRSHVDPANYPLPVRTLDVTLPKKAETVAAHQLKANNPEARARLNAAYEAAKGHPAAHDFYAMKQLEDAFVKELGPEAGRAAFKSRFADPLAATTGGADPNSNLMTAAYTSFMRQAGKDLPEQTYELPFPVGGRFIAGNIDQARKYQKVGELSPVDNPKRYNFASNFQGHLERPTVDEQMMRLFDPKGKMAPDWYGINEDVINQLAKEKGVSPVNFQEVAWAGGKGYEGKPMMQEINEMIHRTSRITGESPDEVLKGFINSNKPMYGIGAGAAGVGATSEDGNFAEGGPVGYAAGKKVIDATRKLILPPAENAARTQIIGTLPTYEKAGSILQQRGATGRGIDFGAGLGEGAKALGKDFDTYEPFAKNWTPTYSNAADVPSDEYGRLTNLNVLNVVPREIRDEIVQDIGRVMQPGGLGIITTRGKDVMNAKGLAGPEPMSVITSRDTYQKGFNKDELEEYLKYMLGDKFDINRLNLGPAGALIKKKAEGGLACMKEGGSTPAWQRSEGKNPEGGLNAAGRASYNRETGGNLKAPQPEGGPRKKSFCARMEGMKKKNTSSATANDPDSRINKSLRKWKC